MDGTDTEIRVSQKTLTLGDRRGGGGGGEEKQSPTAPAGTRTCDLFDHESCTVTTEPSPTVYPHSLGPASLKTVLVWVTALLRVTESSRGAMVLGRNWELRNLEGLGWEGRGNWGLQNRGRGGSLCVFGGGGIGGCRIGRGWAGLVCVCLGGGGERVAESGVGGGASLYV